ncbi:MAG: VWA domain-containing protein [Candidatus Acidiferrales bacterium]
MHRQLLNVLCCIIFLSTCASAQETDPYTGQPANPGAPVINPDPDVHRSRTADEERKLAFKSQTILVQVPTVVADKAGNHVHNLNKDAFKILENGKQQRIAIFDEVNAGSSHPAQAANQPGTFSNFTLERQPFAITVIALDTINTPFLDQTFGRRQLIKYLADNLESGRVFGLVVFGRKGLQVLSGLNGDPASVVAALKKASGEMSAMETFGTDGKVMAASGDGASELTGGISPGADPVAKMQQFILGADAVQGSYHQTQAIEDTLKAFLAIAWSLSGVPGRKSLVWATGSFPFTLDSPSSLPGGNLSLLYERTMEALNDAQVSVYPVDVRGLVNTSPTADATYSGDLSGPGFADAAAERNSLQTSSVRSLENFAEMTGGRAFFNNNDVSAGFKRAADDSSSYYLLGYYVDNLNTKPGWRKLQVQVARKDVEVHARTGFLVTNATIDPELTHKDDVAFALSSQFDSTGLEVTVRWQGITAAGTEKMVRFAVHLPAMGVIDERDKNRFDIDFIAQATKVGAPVRDAAQTIKGAVPAASMDKIKADGILYQNALELPAGDYQVRFVVRDNLSGRIGSVSAPLTVN